MHESSHQLAAIMFTDIVGYTALMGSDEDRAFEVLRKNQEIHKSVIRQFNGILIKEIGDGMLISFSLASDAVKCAIEIQKKCKKQDYKLKIGIHEGEMVFAGDDVYGDGVNIASRLQKTTQEGCIAISEKVYSDIKNKTEINTRLIGDKKLKGVNDPVKVYEVLCGKSSTKEEFGAKWVENTQARKRSRYIIFSGIFIVLIAVFLSWYYFAEHPVIELDKSIAVLPFADMSQSGDQQYFADGVMEDILTNLQRLEELKVTSRTSVEQYRNSLKPVAKIGTELNVSYLLEGSVRKSNGQVMITVQLINAKEDRHIWANNYRSEYSTKGLFEVQKEIADKIVNELKLKISPEKADLFTKPVTQDIEAYNLYLKGRYHLSRRTESGFNNAILNFNNATELDKNFSLAYSGLSDSYRLRIVYGYSSPKDDHSALKEAALKALNIDPNLPQAKNSLTQIKLWYNWDWFGARQDFEQIIKLNPNYAEGHQRYANVLTIFGNHNGAIYEAKVARELDPLAPIISRNVGRRLYFARKYDLAIEESIAALEIAPNFYPTFWTLGLSYLKNEMYNQAIEELQRAVTYSNGNIYTRAILSYAYAIRGDDEKANSILNEIIIEKKQKYIPPISLCIIYIGLKNYDQAFVYLDQAYEEKSDWLPYLKCNPIYDPIRSDQRFQKLINKLNFP